MAVRGSTHVVGRKSEDFCERMFWLCLICHARRSLSDHFEFFE
jgi:hypothetical protein